MHKNYFSQSFVLIVAGVAAAVFVFCHVMAGRVLNFPSDSSSYSSDMVLRSITPRNSIELERLFREADFGWPLPRQTAVPPLLVQSLPRDISAITGAERKKALFLRVLLPMVLMENQKIRSQRKLILQMLMAPKMVPRPGSLAEQALRRLILQYRIDRDIGLQKSLAKLLIRLDEIPPSLVLAQGVIESGWGSSRFALQGNSLFGEWTYRPSQGLAPQSLDDDRRHFVRSFPDIYSSLRSYMNNLNTGAAYQAFRIMRAEMRRKHQPLKAMELAAGLEKYSSRGLRYVDYVRKVIGVNNLQEFDELSLAIQVY
jgi:Bax protein